MQQFQQLKAFYNLITRTRKELHRLEWTQKSMAKIKDSAQLAISGMQMESIELASMYMP